MAIAEVILQIALEIFKAFQKDGLSVLDRPLRDVLPSPLLSETERAAATAAAEAKFRHSA